MQRRTSYGGAARRRLCACLYVATSALLTGCGFQLAGSVTDVEVPTPVYVAATDRYSPFYLGAMQRLRASGIAVTDTLGDAATILTIRRDETGARVLSVSAQNVPREFEVFYTVSYDLAVGSELRVVANDITLARDYTWNETQVLGKAREEEIIRAALADLLLEDFVRRVAETR